MRSVLITDVHISGADCSCCLADEASGVRLLQQQLCDVTTDLELQYMYPLETCDFCYCRLI